MISTNLISPTNKKQNFEPNLLDTNFDEKITNLKNTTAKFVSNKFGENITRTKKTQVQQIWTRTKLQFRQNETNLMGGWDASL